MTTGEMANGRSMMASSSRRPANRWRTRTTAQAIPKGLVVDFIAKEANHEISQAPINELGWNFCGPGYSRFGSSIRPAEGPTNLYWTFSCCPDEWILGAVLVTPS